MTNLREEEVVKHLNVTVGALNDLVRSNLVLAVTKNNIVSYPMFQFNGEALDVKIIAIAQQFKKNGISSENICEWFETYSEALDSTPAKYIKENGADRTIKAVANLASDIFLL